MAKVPTGIKITDLSTKWGLVSVYNADGSIQREYSISAEEADAVAHGNNVLPPGCSEEEWYSGLVSVATRPCNVGEAVDNGDGFLVVNHGFVEDKNKGTVDVLLTKIDPTKWKKKADTVLIEADVAAVVDVPHKKVKP